MRKPISIEVGGSIQKKTQTPKAKQLYELLKHNRKVQQELKKARGLIAERMDTIDEYISTFRLKKQFPRSTALLSLLNFQKNLPEALKEQNKIMDKQGGKSLEEDDTHDRQAPQKKKKGKAAAKDKHRSKKMNKSLDLSLLPTDPALINFVEIAKITEFTFPIDLYKEWYEHNKKKQPKVPFTEEEERTIKKVHQKYSVSWEKICQIIDWRPFEEIYYEYQNRLNPKITCGRWHLRQSLMLLILLEHFGAGKWALISQKFVIKSQLQVRERYCNVLDPNLGKDSYWTKQMEQKLMQVARQYGYKWNEIAKIDIFKNKSDNCIWRRFRSIMVKNSKQEILKQTPEHGSRGLADRILKYKQQYDKRNRKFPERENKQAFDPNERARQLRQNSQNIIINARQVEVMNISQQQPMEAQNFIQIYPEHAENEFRYFDA